MRATERVLVMGGVIVALLLAFSSHQGGAVAWGQEQAGAVPPRVATVDMFAVCEKYMNQPDLAAPRDALLKQWQDKLKAAEQELQQMQSELQVLAPSDPQARVKQSTFQERQGQYQQALQEGNNEVERFRSQQLIDAFAAARVAVNAVAARSGYTHVIATRGPDAQIAPVAMQFTIQELLARPVITGPAADDITAAVATELKLQ